MKVRDVLSIIQKDGWFLAATRGSHRQFKHLIKPGRVTVPGKPSDDLARLPVSSCKLGSRNEKTMRYAVVIEKAQDNFSAYVPDLPGCVATGATICEIELQIREAIEFHLDGMRENGTPIPMPASRVEYVDIAA